MIGRSLTDPVGEPPRATDAVDVPSELSLDDIYHLLQTKRRRDVLRYLRDADGPVRMRELAEQVAAWEQGTNVEQLSSDERQRVYISLYQSHLPKLDNHGIVDYDKDRGLVEPTALTPRLDPFIEGVGESGSTDPWPRRYAATVALCGLVLGTIAAGIAPLSGFAGAVLVLGAFAIATSVHAWSTGAVARTGDR